jgi:hypothetical protein
MSLPPAVVGQVEPLQLPDVRRPEQMPCLPVWAASHIALLRTEAQPDPNTGKWREVPTLPKNSTCGTDPATVKALLSSATPVLMVTDPPYGVNYDPEWRHRAGVNSSSRTGKVENDERADWAEAWALFPGHIAYVWHGALHSGTVAASLERQGFTIRAQIIWAKERLVIGRGDYHWQHEPCWYAVRSKGNWTGDRKQTTLWNISSKDQDAETFHGTQKPVECMRRPIVNNSSPGEAVYEPFLGSGTTLIAAETVGRICFAVELSPAYVDVAVRRWQAFTGRKAVRLSDGLEFDERSSQKEGA